MAINTIDKLQFLSFIHNSGHLSAARRARESSPVRDRRSTTVQRNQHEGV